MRIRKCICCGKEYDYCPHCGDYKNQPRWKMNYDDIGCYTAFQTATDYLAGVISKDDAKTALSEVELANRKKFIESVAKIVDEILDEKKEVAVIDNKSIINKVDEKSNKYDGKGNDKKDKYQKYDAKRDSFKSSLI